MTEELAPRPVELVNPATGAVVRLDEATDLLAAERAEVVETKRALDQYASWLDEELTARLDSENTRSAEVGGWRLETKPPAVTKYPVEALEKALDALISAGKLSESVKPRVLVAQPPKPDGREILKLLKHADEAVRRAIFECGVEEQQRRTVSVKRVGK